MAKVNHNLAEKKVVKLSKRTVVGRVVSAKLPQTVTVLVERQKMHPLYHKSILRSQKYLVHDLLQAKLGDMVSISKIKPMSKRKHFQTVKILGQNIKAVASEQLKQSTEQTIAAVMPAEEAVKDQKSEIEVTKNQAEKDENLNNKPKKGGRTKLTGSQSAKTDSGRSKKSK